MIRGIRSALRARFLFFAHVPRPQLLVPFKFQFFATQKQDEHENLLQIIKDFESKVKDASLEERDLETKSLINFLIFSVNRLAKSSILDDEVTNQIGDWIAKHIKTDIVYCVTKLSSFIELFKSSSLLMESLPAILDAYTLELSKKELLSAVEYDALIEISEWLMKEQSKIQPNILELIVSNFDALYDQTPYNKRLSLYLIIDRAGRKEHEGIKSKVANDLFTNITENNAEGIQLFAELFINNQKEVPEEAKLLFEQVADKICHTLFHIDLLWHILADSIYTDEMLERYQPTILNTLPYTQPDSLNALFVRLLKLRKFNFPLLEEMADKLALEANKLSQFQKLSLTLALVDSEKQFEKLNAEGLLAEVKLETFGRELSFLAVEKAQKAVTESQKLSEEDKLQILKNINRK